MKKAILSATITLSLIASPTLTFAQADAVLNVLGSVLKIGTSAYQSNKAKEAQEKAKAEAEQRAQTQKEAKQKQEADEAAAQAQRNDDLIDGKVEPDGVGDLSALYPDAYDGDDLMGAPKIKPDGDLYIVRGRFMMANGRYVLDDGHSNYIVFSTSKKTKVSGGKIGDIQEGGMLSVVGKYVGNATYQTIIRQTKRVAVLNAAHVVIE